MTNKFDTFVNQFGAKTIDEMLLSRLEKLTGHKPHRFLRRGLFYAHRELDELLDLYEKGEQFYLYTGRGPSSTALHIGHIIPFEFTAYLQKIFNAPVVIQITDDEKYLTRNLELEQVQSFADSNIRDIKKAGFDLSKTFIFKNTEYIQHMYKNICKIQKNLKFVDIAKSFGFTDKDHKIINPSMNIGQISFPPIQMAPCFSSSFPKILKPKMRCLIPCAIDQDPYFRLVRDVATKMGEHKPYLIYAKYIPSLKGSSVDDKMSSSIKESAIYLTDDYTSIKKKINSSFSGGGATKKEHIERGAILEVDVAYQYLKTFLEDDDEFNDITIKYRKGEMFTGYVKKRAIQVLNEALSKYRA